MSARPPEKDYRLHASRRWPVELRGLLRVDADLDTDVLDRINLISGIEVIGTCAGHLRGAHIGYQVAARVGGYSGGGSAPAISISIRVSG